MATTPSLLAMTAASAAACGWAFMAMPSGAPRTPSSPLVEQLSLRGGAAAAAPRQASTPSHSVVIGSVGVMAAAAVCGGKAASRKTKKTKATGLKALDLSKEMGACPPVGFWDPLQLSEFDDPAIAAETFRRRRAVEIQHGRVSMLACIGYIVPEYFRWPGFVSPSQKIAFADIPNGFGAWNGVPAVGWWQMIGFVGVVEVSNLSGSTDGKQYPGDFDGYGAFGILGGKGIEDKEKKEKSLLAEINNGRLAMFAIMGMMFQDGLTGQAWGDWSLYTASPLR